MTFMRKFLDMLNMENWGGKKIESFTGELLEEKRDSISEKPIFDLKEENKPSVTEEEIIDSFKKQYFIIENDASETTVCDASQERQNQKTDLSDVPCKINEEDILGTNDDEPLLCPKFIEKEKAEALRLAERDRQEEARRTETEKAATKEKVIPIIDITQYAAMCNAFLEHQEEMEQYEINTERVLPEENDIRPEREIATTDYQHVLFSEFIDINSIIGSRQDYMRSDYTIEPIFYESHQYIYKIWKISKELEKVVRAKKFFELLEEIEKELERINKYSYPKFLPEKEKDYYFFKKDEVLINFLNRSFTDEYRSSLELKTVKGKINRIENWFSVMDYYKGLLSLNALETFESIVDKWQFAMLPALLEPESMKDILTD